MNHKRGHLLLLLLATLVAALLALLVTGCGGDDADTSESTSAEPADAQPKRGGTLRVALVKAHTTFDPHIVNDNPDIQLTRQAYDNLILRDPDDLSLYRCWQNRGKRTTILPNSRSNCARA